LLLVCVPVGHLFNASVSVPVLAWAGVVPSADAMFTWWTWWHGDAMGAVLFTPLMLVAFGQPAAVWRPQAAHGCIANGAGAGSGFGGFCADSGLRPTCVATAL
jgi:integral membrane sensor domain MASE1